MPEAAEQWRQGTAFYIAAARTLPAELAMVTMWPWLRLIMPGRVALSVQKCAIVLTCIKGYYERLRAACGSGRRDSEELHAMLGLEEFQRCILDGPLASHSQPWTFAYLECLDNEGVGAVEHFFARDDAGVVDENVNVAKL